MLPPGCRSPHGRRDVPAMHDHAWERSLVVIVRLLGPPGLRPPSRTRSARADSRIRGRLIHSTPANSTERLECGPRSEARSAACRFRRAPRPRRRSRRSGSSGGRPRGRPGRTAAARSSSAHQRSVAVERHRSCDPKTRSGQMADPGPAQSPTPYTVGRCVRSCYGFASWNCANLRSSDTKDTHSRRRWKWPL